MHSSTTTGSDRAASRPDRAASRSVHAAPLAVHAAPLDPPSRFLPGPRPRRIAHRGLALAAAENTIAAFAAAVNAGADMLETDAHGSADGIAHAFHDPDLLRVASDPRRIDELTAEEIARIELAGDTRIARLDDLLGEFPEQIINIDVKDAHAVAPVARAIARTRAVGRVCVTSFDDTVAARATRAIRATSGATPMRSPSRGAIATFVAACAAGVPDLLIRRLLGPYGALQVPERHQGIPVVTPTAVAAAHRAGCEVHVWTIDEVTDMRRLLESGVDGIVTNRVDLLSALLDPQ